MAFCLLMVDYSWNCSIDCISIWIFLCALINQISGLLKTCSNRFPPFPSYFHWLSFICFQSFATLFVCFFPFRIVIFLFSACLLFSCPSSVHLQFLSFPSFLHSHDFYFDPTIPLGHQPGSLFHQQCHPFLCKS